MEAPRSARPMLGNASMHNACGELSFRSRCSGDYVDLVISEDLKTERATEPPKRWRNWWRASKACTARGTITGLVERRAAGDVWHGARMYPSKDVAQTAVAEIAARNHIVEYLGAFPDGEAP